MPQVFGVWLQRISSVGGVWKGPRLVATCPPTGGAAHKPECVISGVIVLTVDGKTVGRFSPRAAPLPIPPKGPLGQRHATSTPASVAGRTSHRRRAFHGDESAAACVRTLSWDRLLAPTTRGPLAASLRRWDWARACSALSQTPASRSEGVLDSRRQAGGGCADPGSSPEGPLVFLARRLTFASTWVGGRRLVPNYPHRPLKSSYLFNQWVGVVDASYLSKRRSAGCLCPSLPLVWPHIRNMIFSFSSWNRLL